MEDQHLCMEEWRRAMDELAADDPLNAFHEIFHPGRVAVIQVSARSLTATKSCSGEARRRRKISPSDSSFRFTLPLVRQTRTASWCSPEQSRGAPPWCSKNHEYETLLPDVDAAGRGGGIQEVML